MPPATAEPTELFLEEAESLLLQTAGGTVRHARAELDSPARKVQMDMVDHAVQVLAPEPEAAAASIASTKQKMQVRAQTHQTQAIPQIKPTVEEAYTQTQAQAQTQTDAFSSSPTGSDIRLVAGDTAKTKSSSEHHAGQDPHATWDLTVDVKVLEAMRDAKLVLQGWQPPWAFAPSEPDRPPFHPNAVELGRRPDATGGRLDMDPRAQPLKPDEREKAAAKPHPETDARLAAINQEDWEAAEIAARMRADAEARAIRSAARRKAAEQARSTPSPQARSTPSPQARPSPSPRVIVQYGSGMVPKNASDEVVVVPFTTCKDATSSAVLTPVRTPSGPKHAGPVAKELWIRQEVTKVFELEDVSLGDLISPERQDERADVAPAFAQWRRWMVNVLSDGLDRDKGQGHNLRAAKSRSWARFKIWCQLDRRRAQLEKRSTAADRAGRPRHFQRAFRSWRVDASIRSQLARASRRHAHLVQQKAWRAWRLAILHMPRDGPTRRQVGIRDIRREIRTLLST